jgi:NAD(P)-dependent dehydrogenase (short-subunit alcohol dehydrogenase family)
MSSQLMTGSNLAARPSEVFLPALMLSDLHTAERTSRAASGKPRRVADTTALGRAGLPDDISSMIASPLSEDNRRVNAQSIEVSGGMSM